MIQKNTFIQKMLMIISLILPPMFSTQAAVSALSGGWISGGGDPLRFYFAEGKTLALGILQDFKVDDLPTDLPQTHRTWIVENRDALYADLKSSEIEWNAVSTQITCALTDFKEKTKIRLSLEPCRRIASPQEAAKLLIHEITHHLGIRDEEFADLVAISVSTAYEKTKLNNLTFCRTQEHNEILRRLAGTWQMDRTLTARLGGAFRKFPLLQITIEPRNEAARDFLGFGGCALQAGIVILRGQEQEKRIPYVVTSQDGALLMIHPRLRGSSPDGSRLKFRYLTFTKAQNPSDDLLFLGDEDQGANSAFKH